MTEPIRQPPYYDHGTYAPFAVCDAWDLSRRMSAALKYICRHGKKPGVSAIEDLRKAVHCIEMEIERLELQEQI